MPLEGAACDVERCRDVGRPGLAVFVQGDQNLAGGFAVKRRERASFPVVVRRRIVVGTTGERFDRNRPLIEQVVERVSDGRRRQLEGADESVEVDARPVVDVSGDFQSVFTYEFDPGSVYSLRWATITARNSSPTSRTSRPCSRTW